MAGDPRFMEMPMHPSQQQQQQQLSHHPQQTTQQLQHIQHQHPHHMPQSDPAMMSAANQQMNFQPHQMQPMYMLPDGRVPSVMGAPNGFYAPPSAMPGQHQHHQQLPGGMLQPTGHFNAGYQAHPGPSSMPMKMEFDQRLPMDAADFSEDYENDLSGSFSDKNQDFSCNHCDKVYRGKHARSIWRRHLQDKHGIPLSIQPRRTRWDADVNRPKNAEERRERMLESKRRWARKKRAQDKKDATAVKGEDDGEDEEDGASMGSGPGSRQGSALPPSAKDRDEVLRAFPPQPQPPMQSFGPHPDGVNRAHTMMPPHSTGVLEGPHSMPHADFTNGVGAFDHSRNRMVASMSHPGMPARPNSTDGVTWARRPAGPSTLGDSSGGTQAPTNLPEQQSFPQRHQPAGPNSPKQSSPGASQPSSMPIASTPSRVVSHSMGRSASSGSAAGGANPFSLDHHKVSSATRGSGHLRHGSTSGGFLDFGESPSRSMSHGPPSSMRNTLPPLFGTPDRSSTRDDSMFLLKSGGGLGDSAGRKSASRRAWPSMHSGLRSSSDDEREGLGPIRPRSPHASKRGLGDNDDFDDSGISLPTMTPFSKSFGRTPFGNLSNIGATPNGLSSDILEAFPSTVRKVAKRERSDSMISTSDSRRRRQKVIGGSSDDEGARAEGNAKDGAEEPSSRRHRRDSTIGAHFSSPQHSNLARSLGLAPQSAVRGTRHGRTGSQLANVLATPGPNGGLMSGFGGSPFQHSSINGMSFGFTPFERHMPGGMMGGMTTPYGFGGSPGKLGLAWPESIKRPSTMKKTKQMLGSSIAEGRRGSSSLTSNAITASQYDEEDQSPPRPTGMSPSSDDDDDGQFHRSLNETPSRPSGSQAAYRRGGSAAASSYNGSAKKIGPHQRNVDREVDQDEDDEDEDEDEMALMPLRFGKDFSKKTRVGV